MNSSGLAAKFQDYALSHRTRGNKICHYVGIPLIVLSTVGMFAHLELWGFSEIWTVGLFKLDGGVVLIALCAIWYLRQDIKIAIPFLLVLIGFYFAARMLAMPALVTAFVLGWVIQYIGHGVFEKHSPAFYRQLEHLLVGPLWIFAKIIGYRPKTG